MIAKINNCADDVSGWISADSLAAVLGGCGMVAFTKAEKAALSAHCSGGEVEPGSLPSTLNYRPSQANPNFNLTAVYQPYPRRTRCQWTLLLT